MTTSARTRKQVFPTKIISNIEISSKVHLLELEKNINFKAGQVIAATLDPSESTRLYSIASGPNEKTLQILFDIVEDGQLTPPMSKLKKGDTLYISKPFGRFTNPTPDSWWIATGTGIAPFASMIKDIDSKEITLLHGARKVSQFYFDTIFKEKLGEKYLRFCTTESNSEINHGRVTHFLKNSNQIVPERKYYLCGSPDMVVEVRDILLSKEVPFENIIAEIYF